MRILLIDIETSPNTAFVWGIWDQNISLNQLIESSEILCYAAKWFGDSNIIFDSKHASSMGDMLAGLRQLLESADVVVHYNGARFDIPVINREFLKFGYTPPAPYKQVDLYKVAKYHFKFLSNKLDYICQYLGLGKKAPSGMELWVGCMNGDKDAWDKMERYNKMDVELLESLYIKMRPWITNHPNQGAYQAEPGHICPNCAGSRLQRRGFAVTTTRKYQRYVCQDCGHWSRSTISEKPPTTTLTHAI